MRVSRISLSIVWLLLGLAMIAVPAWLGWTRWPAVLSGHPAMLVCGIVCGMLGFVAVAWSIATLAIGDRLDREGDPDRPGSPDARTDATPSPLAAHRGRSGADALHALVAVLAYARPFVATPVAVVGR